MIDILRRHLGTLKTREQKFNATREFLQILILKILSSSQAFSSVAFMGGTALRIVFHLRRFSEDLNFSVSKHSKYDFPKMVSTLERELQLVNLPVQTRTKRGVVDSCMIHFLSVMHDLEIAVARDQKLSIKIEIDTKPPEGAVIVESVVQSEFLFPLCHYDLASLMAGKLHAILHRKYVKGRDYYDLLWYLVHHVSPNEALLRNAIVQTQGDCKNLAQHGWRRLLAIRIAEVDFRKVRADVEPFIEDPSEVQMLTSERFEHAIGPLDL